MNRLLSVFHAFWRFLKRLGTQRKWVAGIAVVVIVGGITYAFFDPNIATDDVLIEERPIQVTLIPVSKYTQNISTSISTNGAETVVRAETSGKIVQVLPVGTRVSPNTTIAQFENAAQRATLLQTEGSLEAANALLEKTQGGPRSEKIAVLEAAYESAQSGVVNTLLSAYAAVDSAVRDVGDEMFNNPETATPQLKFSSSNAQRRIDLENQRVALGPVLDRESIASATISKSADFQSELATTENEIRQTRTFVDTLITALNEAIATGNVTTATIASYKSGATAARTSLTTSLTAIASARANLETSKQNLEEGLTGAEDSDVSAALAAVKQAQGSYNAALAAYRKTVVGAPTAGTIVACNAALGDILSVGSDVCRIKSATTATSETFILPLSSVKYSPTGAFVFVVSAESTLEAVVIEVGLVTANGLMVTGLLGDEFIVSDVRGLKPGETVRIQ